MAKTGFRVNTWPNGEFTIGYVPPRRFDTTDVEEYQEPRNGQKWWWFDPEKWKAVVAKEILDSESFSPLGLSHLPNSHKRGKKGITSYGARLVRNAAHMLQTRYTNRRLSFLTLTCPSMTHDEYICIAAQWSEIVRVFNQELVRELERHGLSPNIVGVTEIQTKRLKAKKGLGLHLHLVFHGRHKTSGDWAIAPQWFRGKWLKILSGVLGRPVESEACESVKMVVKSAAGYLGKYMTKGKQEVEEVVAQYGAIAIPTAWYTCSLKIRRAVKSCIVTAWDEDIDVVSHLPEWCDKDVVEWVLIHQIEIRERSFVVGFSGRFNLIALASKVPLRYDELCHYDPTGV